MPRLLRNVFLFISGFFLLVGCASMNNQKPVNDSSPSTVMEKNQRDQLDGSTTDRFASDSRNAKGRKSKKSEEEGKPLAQSGKAVFTLDRSVIFESGSDRVRRSAWPFLDKVARYLSRFPDRVILIVGSVTDGEINKSTRPWRLSTDRAINVVDYLSNYSELNKSQFIAGGTGYHDLLKEHHQLARSVSSRRVDIYLLGTNFPGEFIPVKEASN